MSNTQVERAVTDALVASVTNPVERVVLVVDSGVGGVQAGALGQSVGVANTKLVSIKVVHAFVIMTNVAGHDFAGTDGRRHANHGVAGISVVRVQSIRCN